MTEEELKKIFSSNIAYFISMSGKQQKEVAKDLGIAPTTFNTWCCGKILPTLPKLQRIASYFGCSVEDLLTPLLREPTVRLEATIQEAAILRAFKAADPGTRAAIAKLLDVTLEEEKEGKQ